MGLLEQLNDINLEDLSTEELKSYLHQCNDKAKKYHNYEQAVKLTLNSIYGAFGNEWFYFYNLILAESITLQSQDAILYSERMMNKYFYDAWHLDKETHKKLGITVTGKVIKPVVVYIDTDSCYVSFQEVLDKCDWQGDEKDFVLNLEKIRLKEFNEQIFAKYAEEHNTDNFLNFEMESVAKSAIWMAKKKYIQDLVWKDPDIHMESLSKIKAKGFETIQSFTPPFARLKLKELLTFIFSKEVVTVEEMVKQLKRIRKEFKLTDIDDIAFSLRVNKLNDYVVIKGDTLELLKGCQAHTRGAGYHNHGILTSKFKNKYKLITNGEKVKFYYTNPIGAQNVFSYSPGEFPYEIAPRIDYDMQFEKTIIDPMNRVLSSIGLQTLDKNLIYSSTVF